MKSTKMLLGFLVLLWVVGVVLAYYTGHKPLTPELALALGLAGWRILVAAGLVSLAGGLGRRIWPGEGFSPLESLALQAALGLGIFALLVLGVGATLGLPRWLLWAALPFLAVLLRRSILGWWQEWRAFAPLWKSGGRAGKVLGIGILLLFAFELLAALAPPLQFDSLVDHLVMANAYLDQGRVTYLPWITMSGMPQNAEMLYTWAIALGSDPAAAVLGWAFGLLAVVALLGYLSRVVDGRAAWTGVAALLSGFTAVSLLASAYVDWLALLFGLGTIICLDQWRHTGERRILVLAGIFTGLAVGTKYTAGVLALTALAVLAWHAWKQRKAFIPAALQFGLVALLTDAPWLLKNWLSVGNPLYPFFFTSGIESQVHFEIFQRVNPWGNALDLFLLPVQATLTGNHLGAGYMFSIGPLLLALGALAWLGWKEMDDSRRVMLQNAAILAAAGLLVWAVANQINGNLIQTRYYMTLFPAFVVLAALGEWGLRKLALSRVRLGRLVMALVVLSLGFNLLEVGSEVIKTGAGQTVLGLKSPDAFLAENLGWFQPAMKAIRDLPEGSRVMLVYEPRSLYCLPRCEGDEIMGRWKQTRALYSTPAAMLDAWRTGGFTHVMVYRLGVEFLVEANDPNHPLEDLQTLNAFLATLPPPENIGGVYELYELKI